MIWENDEFYRVLKQRGSVLGLENMKALMSLLDNCQNKIPTIHITGTNGKGSVGCFLREILKKSGMKVGHYHSPAVFDALETIQINGKNITQEKKDAYLLYLKQQCEVLSESNYFPTLFEIETAIAFLYFWEEKCDIAIVEVGMGGALDATNVIDSPICSVFTSISLDHRSWLGNTLEDIAFQKSGILKKDCQGISTWQAKEVTTCLQKAAKEIGAPIHILQPDEIRQILSYAPIRYITKEEDEIELSLVGDYQIQNSYLAYQVVSFLKKKGFAISELSIHEGLKEAFWPGRMECICKNPLVILDGAHNRDAALQLKTMLARDFTNMKITLIIGALADKDYSELLDVLLPFATDVIAVEGNHERALSKEQLFQTIEKKQQEQNSIHTKFNCYKLTIEQSVMFCKQHPADLTLVTGSLSHLNEFREALGGNCHV